MRRSAPPSENPTSVTVAPVADPSKERWENSCSDIGTGPWLSSSGGRVDRPLVTETCGARSTPYDPSDGGATISSTTTGASRSQPTRLECSCPSSL